MKKFYIKSIIETTSGVTADETKYVFADTAKTDKQNEDEAVKRFHLLMGANMNADEIAICTLMIVCDNGDAVYVAKQETYRKDTTTEAEA